MAMHIRVSPYLYGHAFAVIAASLRLFGRHPRKACAGEAATPKENHEWYKEPGVPAGGVCVCVCVCVRAHAR